MLLIVQHTTLPTTNSTISSTQGIVKMPLMLGSLVASGSSKQTLGPGIVDVKLSIFLPVVQIYCQWPARLPLMRATEATVPCETERSYELSRTRKRVVMPSSPDYTYVRESNEKSESRRLKKAFHLAPAVPSAAYIYLLVFEGLLPLITRYL